MKTFYIIDENGEFYSEDRKVRYSALSGKALHKYLSTEEGKSKYFSKDVDDYGNVIGIEIPIIHKAKQEKERRHARHLRDTREKYTVWSIDACIGDHFEEILCDVSELFFTQCDTILMSVSE